MERGFTRLVDFGDATKPRAKSASPKFTTGFTLIEILVVVGIITLLFAAGAFIDSSNFGRELLASERSTLVSVLQKARSRAMNNVGAEEHNVTIDSDNYILDGDEEIDRNENIEITGIDHVTFEQLSGETEDIGDIILSDSIRSKTITVHESGLIEW